MDGNVNSIPYPGLDEIAEDGVFTVFDENDSFPYSLMKCVEAAKAFGIDSGGTIPDNLLEECLA